MSDKDDDTSRPQAAFPSQKELEKEISEYLSNKYGRKVRIISAGQFPGAQADDESSGGGDSAPAATDGFHFDVDPEDLIAHLDQYVVGQEEAKAVLATKICTHFNRISRSQERQRQGEQHGGGNVGRIKNNVLLIGPTGVGKTYLIKLIARHLGVPFVKGDATKFSETGYVGGDVDDLIRDLVREADQDLERARFGIVYLDEVDKIAGGQSRQGLDVSRSGVQRALLKPMEETEVEMKVPHDPIAMMEAVEHYRQTGKRRRQTVNTRHILFIMSGAFGSLEETVRRRLQQRSIGFENRVAAADGKPGAFLKRVKPEDLVEYGFESEFIGRLPVVAVLDELAEDDLYQILSSPNSSVIVSKKQDFQAYGIELRFEDAALRELAALAANERTGARALVSVVERALLHFERKLPSTEIRHLVVDSKLVADPAGTLGKLLRDSRLRQRQVKRCATLAKAELKGLVDFIREKLGDYLESRDVLPTPARLEMMAKEVQAENLEPAAVCERFIELVKLITEQAEQAARIYGVDLSFNDEAVDRILARQPRDEASVTATCDEVLAAMEYGLRLLGQRREIPELVITATGIDSPDIFINQVVSKTFRLE
ncbi:MAG: AAA family ATPase [Desulfurivibrio sp.]|nr:AAA family ATPase [Desulfurivibrio sp.]